MNRDEKIDYLVNIYAAAAVDGSVERIEERVYEEVGKGIGAGYYERTVAKEKVAKSSSELPAPLAVRWSEQIRNLEDMLFLAYCDGTLDPAEKKYIINYANSLNINQAQLAAIRDEAKQRHAEFK